MGSGKTAWEAPVLTPDKTDLDSTKYGPEHFGKLVGLLTVRDPHHETVGYGANVGELRDGPIVVLQAEDTKDTAGELSPTWLLHPDVTNQHALVVPGKACALEIVLEVAKVLRFVPWRGYRGG